MNNILPQTIQLRIWQRNLNASKMAQLSTMNYVKQENWDIIALQEPHINPYDNTYSNRHYHMVYPSTKYTSESTTTLISTTFSTNSWIQIPFPSPDVVVIQLSSPFSTCTLFNIYNVCNNNGTIIKLDKFLNDNIKRVLPSHDNHMIWLRDFNRHHPLWEDE